MPSISTAELMPALEEEQRARSTFESIGAEIQRIHRAKGSPSHEQMAALRQAAIDLVTAGQAVLEIIDRPPPDTTGSP